MRVVCDFRSAAERRASPTQWRDSPLPIFELLDIGDGAHDLSATEGAARELIAHFYREVPLQRADRFAAVFNTLVAGELPRS